ncbi:MAG: site-2 protease family protein [Polyangiales bacterium]
MLEGAGVKIFSVRGVPVRLHWTFFLALPWIALSMSRRFDGVETPSIPPILWGAILALLLFGSVFLHELGHVFVARAQGAKVSGITLMLLGGVSQVDHVSEAPRAEAKMAIAGPMVSFAIALVAYALSLMFVVSDVHYGLRSLAQMNLAIGIFNLVPAFPLDGGRVLRSLLEPRRGKPAATRIAAVVGRTLAIVLGALAVLSGNLILGLIAIFVWAGAGAEAAFEEMRSELAHVRVGDIARGVPVVFAEDLIEHAASMMLSGRLGALLVRRADGAVGVVTVRAIGDVPFDMRRTQTIGSIARFDVPTVDATTNVAQVLEPLARVSALPVVHRGALAGVLERAAIAQWLEMQRRLRPSLA